MLVLSTAARREDWLCTRDAVGPWTSALLCVALAFLVSSLLMQKVMIRP